MLKGYKVHLRLLKQKDIDMLHIISNEENVKRYNIQDYDIERSKRRENLRKALSIVNEKNILIGFITYKQHQYYQGIYSIGITIGSEYWGRKYGQDAIKTLLKYLFLDLNAIKVELEVIKNNLRAIRCYKKCGFKEESIKKNNNYINGEYVDTLIMSIIKEDINYI